MEKFDRIMEITNWYLERFGRALIGIYYLPPLAENWKFTGFFTKALPFFTIWGIWITVFCHLRELMRIMGFRVV